MNTELAPVRPGEDLPVESLTAWLGQRLAGASSLEVWQFPSGHSNLTYLIRTRTPAAEYVLRRPPLGPVPPKAHDMMREFAVLQALEPWFSLAPRPVVACDDPAVIGAPFFVMERRRGVIPREGLPAAFAGITGAPEAISRSLIDGLARLHRIEVTSTGIFRLGRPTGFLERQVGGWTERWRRALTEPVPDMEPVIEWLTAARPEPAHSTVVHQDYKLDNVMFDPRDPGRLTAVLDWEMATVGDPLADLGLTLTYWSLPEARAVSGMDESAGWWSREAMIARYAEGTGFDTAGLLWYEVLGTFKLAVIVQQIYARYARGQTEDARFEGMGRMAVALARRAHAMIG
jgi:aminoglycoside phosphotransferase (APT) family kinase protein